MMALEGLARYVQGERAVCGELAGLAEAVGESVGGCAREGGLNQLIQEQAALTYRK